MSTPDTDTGLAPSGPRLDRDAILARFTAAHRDFPHAEVQACLDDRALGREVTQEALRLALEAGANPPDDSPLLLALPVIGALANAELLPDLLRLLELDHDTLDLVVGDALLDLGGAVIFAVGRAVPQELEAALLGAAARPSSALVLANAIVHAVVLDGFDATRARAAILTVLDTWEREGFPDDAHEMIQLDMGEQLGQLGFVADHERLHALRADIDSLDDTPLFLPREPGTSEEAYRELALAHARASLARGFPVDALTLASWPAFRSGTLQALMPKPALPKSSRPNKARDKKKAVRKQKQKARRKK